MRQRLDPLAVVEHAYDVDSSDDAWLPGILDAAAPALDVGAAPSRIVMTPLCARSACGASSEASGRR